MIELRSDETLAYHSARLLILIAFCGTPQVARSDKWPGIRGRTLLAKLDFFLRYPSYLIHASRILNRPLDHAELRLDDAEELQTVESRMVRYHYGPWDHVYYIALAYLIGKELIKVEMERGTEVFRLTDRGAEIAFLLADDPDYRDLAMRARGVHRVFRAIAGGKLKAFIYTHFPEVVARKLGDTI